MTNEDKDRILRRIEIEISDTFIWDFVFKARDGKTDIDEASNGIFDYVMECIQAVLNEEASDKYRWHDLRKNPEDLPGENDFCVIKTLYNSRIGYDICIYNPNDYLCWESVLTDYSNSVTYAVAWVSFDPFEEV